MSKVVQLTDPGVIIISREKKMRENALQWLKSSVANATLYYPDETIAYIVTESLRNARMIEIESTL